MVLHASGRLINHNVWASVFLQSLKKPVPRNGYNRTCAAFFRTSAGIYTPHETPPMRQSPASVDITIGTTSNNNAFSGNEEAELEQPKQNDIFERILLNTLTYTTKVYDTLTLPAYALVQQPWKTLAAHNAPKGILLDEEKMTYGTLTPKSKLHAEIEAAGMDTMEKIFGFAVAKNSNKRCLGTRSVVREVDIDDPLTGKQIKKYELGDYKWKTYAEVDKVAANLASGLAAIGIQPKSKVAIFAETRMEWLITAMAAFKRNLQIVTIFTTLGDEGVIHALSETDVQCVVTTEELLPRCQSILKKCPPFKNLIYIDDKNSVQTQLIAKELGKSMDVSRYSDLVELGEQTHYPELKPSRHDRAIIMYTSGSTGIPKGVVLSHWNLVCSFRSVLDNLALAGEVESHDAYIAYLPLAHVLELVSEALCFVQGIPIGYSSPLTMTDQSPGVLEGSKGDCSVLHPTIMAGVPLVIERICKGIQTKVAERGKVAKLLFDFFYNYKVGWKQRGYETPLVDKLILGKIRSLVGGRLRFMAVGSAPLAPETHEFIRTILSCPIVIGYAMTETACCGSLGVVHDLTTGRAGPPLSCTTFRLIDWAEGGYRVTDKPNPRGEIVIGGDNVANGYYKRDHPDFFFEDGKQWIRTGDIGEVHPDGVFKIIDRKKDLVKLCNGEFVSLGKIESITKSHRLIENVCVRADPSESYPVAVIVPAQPQLEKLAAELNIVEDSYGKLCQNPVIKEAVLQQIQSQGQEMSLSKYEIPKKIFLCPEPWMPSSGLVTAAFKIKRNNVYKAFEKEIADMYKSLD